MKKKLKKETPVIETKPVEGSVGEFIELLKNFPSDAKFELNGSADILNVEMGGELKDITINPVKSFEEAECDCEPFFDEEAASRIAGECNCDCDDDKENPVMGNHLFGFYNEYPEFVDDIRHIPSDRIIETPVMMPYKKELYFEGDNLKFNQILCIDEIRQHNMYVAECMAELYRRQIAGLLEYNTQCLAHFGAETNKVMCTIVDSINND